ncbi:hypothetical protein [Zobellia uliginosa]|uniref:hypothetical protein n=1 Tax=Zobellia uliginosa TaxID=143224 RepID=UPI001C079353|nr:hypothetical protein [Zobellia uliginosa]MBU2945815.1 hypothetical protein [Zobellia uliginosa]
MVAIITIIELKHIKIELENSRSHHIRHFIDQYYCYKNNYVTKTGNPAWNKIFWSGLVSLEAAKEVNRKQVVKEHVVPVKVITQMLQNLGLSPSLSEIGKVLDDWLLFATITKNENKELNDLGLSQKMPTQFYDSHNVLYQDKFARYKLAGISLVKLKQ